MATDDERGHGTTPGLHGWLAERTAGHQAAFFLPYLKPEMAVLDCGCGPGTISVGLAEWVKPGQVIGIDHDRANVAAARENAKERKLDNVTFRVGDAFKLPFRESSFDAVFENNLLLHIGQPLDVAREMLRVLKPGGVIGARDGDQDGWLTGGADDDAMIAFLQLHHKWQASRGSNVAFGKQLPIVLDQAGFDVLDLTTSYDTFFGERLHALANRLADMCAGQMGRECVEQGWANEQTVAQVASSFQRWADQPNAFAGNAHVEVVGRKPLTG